MPITSGSDISLVLSGGTININPNDSLGGDPSSSPVVNAAINNLFADVTADQTEDGYEDYRCVYLFNDGDTSVYSFSLWIEQDFEGGAVAEVGITDRNESQRVTVSGGTPTGGSFTLSYKEEPFTVTFDSDLAVWAASFQTALDELEDGDGDLYFASVTVTAQSGGSGTTIFDIAFSGIDGKRNLDKFAVESNDLTGGTFGLLVTAPSEGSPVNTVAPEINVETTPPGGVTFYVATRQSPITIPVLHPTDGFPLWIKRTVEAGAEAKEQDGFILSFRAESLQP